ncbi:MAG: ANTAR domain-containing protein [Bryobacteraceae bacterium]
MNNQRPIDTNLFDPKLELTLLRHVSRIVAHGNHLPEILEGLTGAVSEAGIAGWAVHMEEAGPEWDQGDQHWGSDGKVSVSAPIAAQGRTWGEIELYCEATGIAAFLGQQLGVWLWKRELAEENAALKLSRAWMGDRIATDKAVSRAKALLAKTRRISPAEAEKMIRQHSLQSGRDLREVAEALVTANSKTLVQGDPRWAAPRYAPRYRKSA